LPVGLGSEEVVIHGAGTEKYNPLKTLIWNTIDKMTYGDQE
jgi:hypothetical protein